MNVHLLHLIISCRKDRVTKLSHLAARPSLAPRPLLVFIPIFFARPTDPPLREGGRWETKHFMEMALPNNKRDYSYFDESALIEDIQSVDWDGLLRANPDPNVMFDSFYTRISDIIDFHIPLIQLSKRELRMKSKPWITSALRVSIKKYILCIFQLTLYIITPDSNFIETKLITY